MVGLYAYNGTEHIQENKSTVSYCYDSGNVTSKNAYTGGIVGRPSVYCEVKNCYIYSDAKIQYNGTDATDNIGSAENNYLGKILGNLPNNVTEENNDVLDEMPTVYYVVNGLSDGESEYWSNSNLDQPKLLWEK